MKLRKYVYSFFPLLLLLLLFFTATPGCHMYPKAQTVALPLLHHLLHPRSRELLSVPCTPLELSQTGTSAMAQAGAVLERFLMVKGS